MALSTATDNTSISSSVVSLLELSAAAVACTVSASKAILKIAEANEKNTRTKDDGSFVTDADGAAQFVIVQALRTVSSDILIVGEESQEEMERLKGDFEFLDPAILEKTRQELSLRKRQTTDRPLPLRSVATEPDATSKSDIDSSEYSQPKSPIPPWDDPSAVVDTSRVCVIVDPLDGTKSYASGEHDVVSILIGIILDNKPYFGVIGKPFGYFTLSSIADSQCVTIYGGPLLGGVFVAGAEQVIPKPIQRRTADTNVASSELPRAVISSSRSKGVVHDFCLHLGDKGLIHPDPLLISGAGEKSLRLVLQRHNEAVWFYPKPGTSLWDVAAPDALLRALGGRLSDKYGNEMDYSKSRADFENSEGVVACIDTRLHAQCIDLFQDGDWLDRP